MAEMKTRFTDASVDDYVEAIEDDERRADCKAIAKVMRRVTGKAPRMFGTAIVGFGSYDYTYASGRTGTSCVLGFSSRKADISIYLAPYLQISTHLARLGRHKMGKGCLYVRRVADIDLKVFEEVCKASVAETRKRHG